MSRLEGMIKSGMMKPAEKNSEQKAEQTAAAHQAPAMASVAQSMPGKNQQINKEAPKDISGEEVSGRILGRIGIGAVVLGVAFFLKYAFDNDWIDPTGRVILGIMIGIVIMGIGQWLRKKYLGYSDLLMGGGLAILYISIFSSFALYHLVDPMTAFFGMVIVTAVGVIISIIDATQTLSVIALIGGFLSPFLIGVTELGPWITFTYITILNGGTLGILTHKRWPNLILIALIGTWIYFGTWLSSSYTDALLVPTLLFVLIQFLILTASSVIRIIVEKAKATQLDYFVLAGTAFSLACVCYYLLMPEYKHYFSVGSVLVAGFYIVLALIAYKENPQDKTLNIFLPGLAVAFLTIAVPVEFSGPWICAWWFVEALVLYIVASSSSSRGFQIMGVVVYILGLFDLLTYIGEYQTPPDHVIFFNAPFILLIFAAGVAYAISFFYRRYGSTSVEIQKRGISVFVVLANILTLYALTAEVSIYYDQLGNSGQYMNWSNTAISVLWALYAVILTVIGFAKRFPAVRRMGLVLFLITAFKVLLDVWSLGELYRIISFIVFGIIALSASFIYVRYRDRLKDIV
jgi:uncharacterized membrane protein